VGARKGYTRTQQYQTVKRNLENLGFPMKKPNRGVATLGLKLAGLGRLIKRGSAFGQSRHSCSLRPYGFWDPTETLTVKFAVMHNMRRRRM
jgi:hypothetical protein